MIPLDFHSKQFAHNRKFASDVLRTFKSEYNDWTVTSLFYSAVHLIDRYFDQHVPNPPKTHVKRFKLIRKDLKPIYPDYDRLYSLSIQSRYDASYTRISAIDVQHAKSCLAVITAHIQSIP